MSNRKEHLRYRNEIFHCSIMKPVLSEEEYAILAEYGTWMMALYQKKITPLNEQQQAFCQRIISEKMPEERFAKIFWKYLKRCEIAKENHLNNIPVQAKDDRKDWEKIRNMRF